MARNLKDAFYNAQFRVGQGIYTRAVSQGAAGSLTQANFESFDTFTNLVDDASVMNEFAGSQLLMEDVSKSSKGMETVAASQTARDVIGFSGLAYDTIANSNMAIGKYAIGYTTESPSDFADMDAVVASQTAMNAVAASQTAMDAVISSQLALDTVVASQTAMDAVTSSQLALDTVVASQTAMDAVAASLLARTELLLSQFVLGSVWESVNSEIYLNEGTINVDSSFGGDGIKILQGGTTVDSSASRTTVSVTRNNDGYAIIGDPDGDGTGSARWTLRHDLTNVSTLKMQIGQSTSTITDIAVEIDGSEVANFSPIDQTGGEEVLVDLSSKSGESDLTIRFDDATFTQAEFGEVSQVRFE